MLRSIKAAIRDYFTRIPDPREVDAMSLTLHDGIRLIEQDQQRELHRENSLRQNEMPAR